MRGTGAARRSGNGSEWLACPAGNLDPRTSPAAIGRRCDPPEGQHPASVRGNSRAQLETKQGHSTPIALPTPGTA